MKGSNKGIYEKWNHTFHRLTLCSLVLSLLHMNPVLAKDDDGGFLGDESKYNTQNRSSRISKCENWFIKFSPNANDGLPWYELKSRHSSYVEALFNQESGSSDSAISSLAESLSGASKKEKMVSLFKHMAYCEAYRAATLVNNYSEENSSEFSNSGDGNSGNSNNQVNTQMVQCMSKATQAEQQSCMQEAQSSGNMTCQHKGWETHDYLDCKRIATFIKGFTVGKAAMQLQQTVRVGNAQIDATQDLTQKQMNGETIQMSDTYKVQSDSLKQQGTMAYEMAAFNGAKAGVLLGMISSFPTKEGMKDRCESEFNVDSLKALGESVVKLIDANKQTGTTPSTPTSATPGDNRAGVVAGQAALLGNNGPTQETGASENNGETSGEKSQFFQSLASELNATTPIDISSIISNQDDAAYGALFGGNSNQGENRLISDLCEQTVQQKNHFFLNAQILDKMKEVALAAGLEALANGAQGALLNKQADIIDDAIKDIKEFEEPDFETAGFTPSMASECLVDPEAEGCLALGANVTSGFGSQSFGSSASGSANLGSGLLNDSDDGSGSSATASDRNLLPNSLGSVQIGTPNNTQFEDGKVRAGTIKPGKGGSGGGGGGGGGAGGASLPGGGGSGGQGSGQLAANSKGSSAVNVAAVGSGLGRVSGGRGSVGATTKASDNPFSKLLGKTKSNANTLNFRGPAQIGKEKGSLFERISSRYQAVSSADKLLKYESSEEDEKKK